MVIIDSTVWVDFLRGEPTPHVEWLAHAIHKDALGLTDLILCEVLQGLRSEADFTSVRQQLASFDVFDSGGEDMGLAAASNHRALRSKGHTIRKLQDCFIATFCIRSVHALLHCDRDFDLFEKHLDLQVIHPVGSRRQ